MSIHSFLGKSYIFRRPLILSLIIYMVVLLALHALGQLNWRGRVDPSHWSGRLVLLTGTVVGQPDPRPKGTFFVFQTETLMPLQPKKAPQSVRGKTLVSVSKTKADFASPGDRLQIVGILNQPKESHIPGTFNYGAYLRNKGIHSILYTSRRSVENWGDSQKHPFLRWGWMVKRKIITIFRKHLTSEQAMVLSGLVVGNRPRFHPEIKRIFVDSGTMHILVASGSNVAFVIGFWFLFVGLFFRLPKTGCLLSSIPLIWMYVWIVGADAPIVRAGVMSTVAIAAYLLAREDRPYSALAVAAFCLLIPQPRMLFDVGFQMSFLTVFGLIYYLPRLDPLIKTNNFWFRWLARIALATLTAQIWLAPLMIVVFKRISPLGLPANTLVMPWSALGLLSGFGLVAMDFLAQAHSIFSPLLVLTKSLTAAYTQILIDVVGFFAGFPFSNLWVSQPHGLTVGGYYLGCLSVVHIRGNRVARWIFGGALLFMIMGFLAKSNLFEEKKFQMSWLDAGRSTSVFIETKTGDSILIVPKINKTSNELERVYRPYFSHRGIKKLDALVLTGSNPNQEISLKESRNILPASRIIICQNEKKFSIGSLDFEVLPGSKSFKTQAPLLITIRRISSNFDPRLRSSDLKLEGRRRSTKFDSILLAHTLSLRTQEALLAKNIGPLEIFQARFSEKIRWDEEFIRKAKPKRLIETGYDSKYSPSRPPWKDVEVIVPQKVGYFIFFFS